jgi:hypothetical protein
MALTSALRNGSATRAGVPPVPRHDAPSVAVREQSGADATFHAMLGIILSETGWNTSPLLVSVE